MYKRIIKRILDFVFAIVLLILLSPLLLIISLCIKLETHGKIIFKQKRIGRNKKTFGMLKFRSMKENTPDVATHLLHNPKQYITLTGRFIRWTSLDELPQLINILKGDMSFIGPRPALWNQFDLIEAREANHVNDVLPGLTGFAQVNGRDELSIEQKIKYDSYYVKNMSFMLDVKILLWTIIKVIKAEGIQEGTKSS